MTYEVSAAAASRRGIHFAISMPWTRVGRTASFAATAPLWRFPVS